MELFTLKCQDPRSLFNSAECTCTESKYHFPPRWSTMRIKSSAKGFTGANISVLFDWKVENRSNHCCCWYLWHTSPSDWPILHPNHDSRQVPFWVPESLKWRSNNTVQATVWIYCSSTSCCHRADGHNRSLSESDWIRLVSSSSLWFLH